METMYAFAVVAESHFWTRKTRKPSKSVILTFSVVARLCVSKNSRTRVFAALFSVVFGER